MSHLSTQELSDLVGISKRQCQRLLEVGKIAGASRTPGKHWKIKDSARLRKWAKDHKPWGGKERKPDHFGVPITRWKRAAGKKRRSDRKGVDALSPEVHMKMRTDELAVAIGRVKTELEAAHRISLEVGKLLAVEKANRKNGFKRWLREEFPELSLIEANHMIYAAETAAKGAEPRVREFLKKIVFRTDDDKERAKDRAWRKANATISD